MRQRRFIMSKEYFDLWKVENGSSTILASSSSKFSLQGKLDNEKFVEEEVRHFRDLDLEPKIVEHHDHLWGLSGIDILGFRDSHVKPSKKCSLVILPHEKDVSGISFSLVDKAVDFLEAQGFWVRRELSAGDRADVLCALRQEYPKGFGLTVETVADMVASLFAGDILGPDEYRVCDECGDRVESGFFWHGKFFCQSCRWKLFSDEEWYGDCVEAEKTGKHDVHWAMLAPAN